MKSRKIAWPMHLPKKSAFAIETPPDVNKLHALILFSGKRGGGKTVACVSYVKKLLDLHLMQRGLWVRKPTSAFPQVIVMHIAEEVPAP